jgi:hypothetical protein
MSADISHKPYLYFVLSADFQLKHNRIPKIEGFSFGISYTHVYHAAEVLDNCRDRIPGREKVGINSFKE